MNPVAEALTGWVAVESYGRPLKEAFRIIHEDSRQAVETPTLNSKVTRSVNGWAEHLLLLPKEGSELPVDECVTPVCDA